MSYEEQLPPNFSKLDLALRSIGYSFEAAVADIIDNSIDANAQNVLVRVVFRKHQPLDVVICDDGTGMDENGLKEAMRFGSDVSQHIQRLGKFGLGLKLASLSQARAVRVFTQRDGALCGRAWLEDGITREFTSSVFSSSECQTALAELAPDRDGSNSGTVVHWSQLYRVGSKSDESEEYVQSRCSNIRIGRATLDCKLSFWRSKTTGSPPG